MSKHDDHDIPAPPLSLPQSQLEEAVKGRPLAAIVMAAIIGLLVGKFVL
jgi:hypothetical protein